MSEKKENVNSTGWCCPCCPWLHYSSVENNSVNLVNEWMFTLLSLANCLFYVSPSCVSFSHQDQRASRLDWEIKVYSFTRTEYLCVCALSLAGWNMSVQQMEKSGILCMEKPSPVCKPRGSQPSHIQTKWSTRTWICSSPEGRHKQKGPHGFSYCRLMFKSEAYSNPISSLLFICYL